MHRAPNASLIMPARELIEPPTRCSIGSAATLLPPCYYGLGDRTEGRRRGRYGRPFRRPVHALGSRKLPVRELSFVLALPPIKFRARSSSSVREVLSTLYGKSSRASRIRLVRHTVAIGGVRQTLPHFGVGRACSP